MKKRWYWLTGVGFFIVGLLAQLPASLLVDAQQQLRGTPLKLYGVSGTLWSGQASVAQLQRLRLQQLQWEVSPLWLFAATLAVDLQANLGDNTQYASVYAQPWGHIKAENVNLDAPLAQLGQQLGIKWLPLQARLMAHFDYIEASDRKLTAAAGSAQLRDSRWALARPPIELGLLGAQVSTENGLITAALDSSNSPLDVSGKATLDASGKYEVDAQIRPLSQANATLRNQLRGLGKQQADGSYSLELSGQLYPEQ